MMNKNTLTSIIREDIRNMKGYHVTQVKKDFIKLDAMEFPYELPNKFKKKLAKLWIKAPLRHYPLTDYDDIIPQIKKTFDIPPHTEVTLGNGSDELIQLISILVAKKDAKVLSFEPTFSMYSLYSMLYKSTFIAHNCLQDLSIDIESIIPIIEKEKPDLIFIAYPNNPTGIKYERADIERIINATGGIVVIDEAYGSFSNDSFLKDVAKYKNLIITKTFSKIGFAGIRVGFAAGHPDIINELKKITPPYNMNQLSLTTAKFVLTHMDYIHSKVKKVKKERNKLYRKLSKLDHLYVFPSQANFLTIRVSDANKLYNTFLKNKIVIKNLHGVHPHLNQCIRITIGLPEENKKIFKIIKLDAEES